MLLKTNRNISINLTAFGNRIS